MRTAVSYTHLDVYKRQLKAVLLLDKEFPAHDENAVTLSKVLSGYSEFDGPCPAHSDDVCCILSTSGTTGKPKQAMFTRCV